MIMYLENLIFNYLVLLNKNCTLKYPLLPQEIGELPPPEECTPVVVELVTF